ncbi:hypothetical protein [Heyndrickxia oleronia]|uniref:hypothetical protein n=1 Tax=Heyndrickxia oleronia TaxID=38875 RepID=UPI00242DF080|nr:hypothetical protein [Heyndrickxia oleronia]MCI1592065.1 hypothetical protein [Heyndrickxia oleronia]MCI1614380.1 hypothetical protein [Heyndrickxia oleronia]MCI1745509.1 hypothetical protein [Heyndrickxia oleronia]MCI1763750.1 hypothetical protein [Heyndrickxia oleronia]
MRNEGYRGRGRDRHHHGEGHNRKEKHVHQGAKTFRRGRAIAFLEMMSLKRDTLKQQLVTPELQTINPILVGELKAVEMVINEFVQMFELYEYEVMENEGDVQETEEVIETSSLLATQEKQTMKRKRMTKPIFFSSH